MDKAFLVQHVHDLSSDDAYVKIVGIYSSKEKAESTVERYRSLPGFKNYPKGFNISEYEIDKDYWEEGFVTVVNEDKA